MLLATMLIPLLPLAMHPYRIDKAADFDCFSGVGILLFILVFSIIATAKPSKQDERRKNWVFAFVYVGGFLVFITYYALTWWVYGYYKFNNALALPFTDMRGALYFSISTATTLGYGDALPCPNSRLFAATEALTCHLYAVLAFAQALMKWPQDRR